MDKAMISPKDSRDSVYGNHFLKRAGCWYIFFFGGGGGGAV